MNTVPKLKSLHVNLSVAGPLLYVELQNEASRPVSPHGGDRSVPCSDSLEFPEVSLLQTSIGLRVLESFCEVSHSRSITQPLHWLPQEKGSCRVLWIIKTIWKIWRDAVVSNYRAGGFHHFSLNLSSSYWTPHPPPIPAWSCLTQIGSAHSKPTGFSASPFRAVGAGSFSILWHSDHRVVLGLLQSHWGTTPRVTGAVLWEISDPMENAKKIVKMEASGPCRQWGKQGRTLTISHRRGSDLTAYEVHSPSWIGLFVPLRWSSLFAPIFHWLQPARSREVQLGDDG